MAKGTKTKSEEWDKKERQPDCQRKTSALRQLTLLQGCYALRKKETCSNRTEKKKGQKGGIQEWTEKKLKNRNQGYENESEIIHF